MAHSVSSVLVCALCDDSIRPEDCSVQVSARHALFPGRDSVKAVIKHLMCVEQGQDDLPFLDEILKDEDYICSSCLEKTATCLHLSDRVESARSFMKDALKEG